MSCRSCAGASQAINSGGVDVVQFEFNEMNVMSRVFFKDFFAAPTWFFVLSLLVAGSGRSAHISRHHELFILQNVIAIETTWSTGPACFNRFRAVAAPGLAMSRSRIARWSPKVGADEHDASS